MAIDPTPGKPKRASKPKASKPKATRPKTVQAAVATAKKAAPRKPAAAKPRTTRAPAPKSRTEQVRETVTERIVKPARDAAATAAEAARDAAQNARETIGNAASQGSSFGLKMIEHAEANAREAFNAMRAAAKSKDVTEVLKVQGEYLREQGARSVAQAREVSELIAKFGRDAIAPLTGRKK